MVVVALLEFITTMIERGQHVHVSAAYSAPGASNKIKICIGSIDGVVPAGDRRIRRQLVATIAAESLLCICMDHGHRHSDMCRSLDGSHCCFTDVAPES